MHYAKIVNVKHQHGNCFLMSFGILIFVTAVVLSLTHLHLWLTVFQGKENTSCKCIPDEKQ